MSMDDEEIKAIASWHMDPDECAEFDRDLKRYEVDLDPDRMGSLAQVVRRARRLLNLYTNDKAYRALLASHEEQKARIEKVKEMVGTPLSDDEPGFMASIYYTLEGKR